MRNSWARQCECASMLGLVARVVCLLHVVTGHGLAACRRKSEFRFTTQKTHSLFLNPYARSRGNCNVCYGSEDCLDVGATWCEYYQLTTGILGDDKESSEPSTDPVLKTQVDVALYNLLHTAVEDPSFTECVPYVSQYTNCDKESICSGCKSCSCDGSGRWSCAPAQQCWPAPGGHHVDHRLLQLAIEKLVPSGPQQDRVKRSFRDLTWYRTSRNAWTDDIRPRTVSTIRPASRPRGGEGNRAASDATAEKNQTTSIHHAVARRMQSVRPRSLASIAVTPDSEIVRNITKTIFEDMQNNSSIGKKMIATQNLNDDLGLDNFLFNELLNNFTVNHTGYNMSNMDHFSSELTKLLTEIEGLNDSLGEVTTVTYEDFYKQIRMLKSVPIHSFSSGNVNFDLFENDDSSDHSARILKRDIVSAVNETTSNNTVAVDANNTAAVNLKMPFVIYDVPDKNKTSNKLKKKTINDTEKISKSQQDLNENVLSPLADIIIEKQNEIAELLNIRKHLIKFIKSNKNFKYSSNKADLKGNKTHFEIYKLEISPKNSSRRQHFVDKKNEIKKYMDKLNNDVLKMVQEISAIQRLLKEQKVTIPNNFITLTKAIKSYIQELKHTKEIPELRHLFNSSNYMKMKKNNVKGVASYIESGFLNVFEMMDKDILSSNILAPLSKTAKKVFMRLILALTDSSNSSNMKIDENTQITNNLKKSQYEWQKIEERSRNTHVSNSLHDLKLVHMAVTSMVNELTRLLYQINFFHSRRMIPLDQTQIETTVNEISQKIESKMGAIHDVLSHEKVSESSTSMLMYNSISITTTKPIEVKKKKNSFMKRLKKMMKKFMPKKIPKQPQEIHKAKLIAMQKDIQHKLSEWQNEVKKRNKRSPHRPLPQAKNRLQHILPKYLRGRFNHNAVKKEIKNSHKKGRSKREVLGTVKVTSLPWWLVEEGTQLPWWKNHSQLTIVNRTRLQRRPQKHAPKKHAPKKQKGIFSVIRDRISDFFTG